MAVGLDAQGQATPALLKKLAALGAEGTPVAQLQRQGEGKAETLFLDSRVAGATLAEGLQKALDEALSGLPIPKVMSYQLADGWSSVNFVRPAHGLVALHGEAVVPVQALGLTAGRVTHGHRFEAAQQSIELRDADSYAEQLHTQGAVIASFTERRAEIVRQLQAAAQRLQLRPVEDEALLDEVTGLVERPNVLACAFDEAFLEVPGECLVLTMKANQKYFPLLDAQGRLSRHFLVVSNIRPADPSRVIEGNQRVVRPRLADAKFFFDQDRKRTLESRVPALAKVVYHAKLGSMGDRVERVRALARAIGEQLGGPPLAQAADRAALLAKADLLSDMVGEFPELQGIMGGYYARHDGESEAVAFAVEDHYKPRFAGDELPRDACGIRAGAWPTSWRTLAGLFGIGQLPSGDKDPVRAAPPCAGRDPHADRTRLAAGHRGAGAAGLQGLRSGPRPGAGRTGAVPARAAGRLPARAGLQRTADRGRTSSCGRRAGPRSPERLAAVQAFAQLPEAAPLAAANKRVGNILKKSEGAAPAELNGALLKEPAERALSEALVAVELKARPAFGARDYTGSLRALAALKAPVDAFFDEVMVNAEDPALRANRLALLAQLHAAMNRVADLSRLAA